jgi:acyl transferase domain-containing protein/NADPH:quinone reductase-like Zn-dependent oxidoreductase/acyl carrier protein
MSLARWRNLETDELAIDFVYEDHMHRDERGAINDRPLTAAAVEAWLRERLATQLNRRADDFDRHERFSRYGLDSLGAASLTTAFSKYCGQQLTPTLVWHYPTIESLVSFVAGDGDADRTPVAPPAGSLSEPIAIVGMACRFPGAADLRSYWRLLRDGVDAISEVPNDRWDLDYHYHPAPTVPGKMSTRWGGFLDQVDRFDAQFFGIAPREAVHMDPQQRLILELAWEALEDAGIVPATLRGSGTGVFCGAMWHDYGKLCGGDPTVIAQYTATGHDLSIIAARVSYLLGLQGPSLTVSTACSSSLVAVHLACQSLRTGEAAVALAGGVNLVLAPESTVAMSKFGAMAPDGRSKAFDARANGYVRGEGAGLVVLKPLSRALADGDPIYCVIRGSAVNNDGFSNGLTAPNPRAQVAMLQDAYARAAVRPERVHYLETHGTGTFLGDPIEANAIGAVLGVGRPADRPLLIGSVKTNIGHLEAAAGMAGLIKTVLAIKHGTVPPNLHFDQPNPHVAFDDLRLRVPREPQPWPSAGEPPIAGVSAFGFGGTNCHLVLAGLDPQPSYLLPLSASDPDRLRSLASRVHDAAGGPVALPDLCYPVAARDAAHPHRLALVVRSRVDLVGQLESWLRESEPAAGVAGASVPRVVFVFPGQGGQWLGMGRQLMRQEPVFRRVLGECEAALEPYVDWSLREVLGSDAAAEAIDVVQPVLFAVQVALAELWRWWGVRPAAVVGHSMGEVAAAYVAGALSLDDAARVICERSRLLRRISGRGAMAVVELAAADAEKVVAPFGSAVVVAAVNGPSTTVVAGRPDAVDAVVAQVSREGGFARRVRVDVASHSPQVEPLGEELAARLAVVAPRAGRVRFCSTVRGQVLDGSQLDAGYWVDNVRQPVRFAAMVERLVEEGSTCFLEISPHPVLGTAVDRLLAHRAVTGTTLASTRRDEDERAAMLDSAAALYSLGQPLRWPALFPPDVELVELPSPPDRPDDDRDTVVEEPTEAVLLPLSAHTGPALRELIGRTLDTVRRHPNLPLPDLCHTSAVRRTHHQYRVAVATTSRVDLVGQLESWLRESEPAAGVAGASVPRVVFVFPGQGGQWLGMGRQLMRQEPVFRRVLGECEAALEPYVDWSLREVLGSDAAAEAIDVVQPVLFAVQVALAELWRWWGVRPAAVVGHSMGEVAAAYVAGALSLDDAARVICERSRLLRRISGRGAMAVVELAAADAEKVVAPFGSAVVVAAVNGPSTTVVAGRPDAVDAVVAQVSREGGFARRVRVDVASHSPQVEPLGEELAARLAVVAPRAGRVRFCSTVRGQVLDGSQLDAGYWVDNVRQPVRFAAMVERLVEEGSTCFLEISPHPVLGTAVEHIVRQRTAGAMVLATLRRDTPERLALLDSLGTLYRLGVPVAWHQLYPGSYHVLPLAGYPWQRERFWLPGQPDARPARRRTTGHPLLGERTESSLDHGTYLWTADLDRAALPYLADHRVREQCVLPAAAYLDLALSAAATLDAPAAVLEHVAFTTPLALPDTGATVIQTSLTGGDSGALTFRCASRQPAEAGSPAQWLTHATGTVRAHPTPDPDPTTSQPAGADYPALRARLAARTAPEHYAAMRARALPYGPSFQAVRHLHRAPGEAIGQLHLPPAAAGRYRIPPALLDGCFQVALAALPDDRADGTAPTDTYLPVGMARMSVARLPGDQVWCHARVRSEPNRDGTRYTADLVLLDEHDQPLLCVDGLRFQQLRPPPAARDQLLYRLRWQPVEQDTSPRAAVDWRGEWLVFDHPGATFPAALAARGGDCVLVHPGETFAQTGPRAYQIDPTDSDHMHRLLAAAFGDGQLCRGVIHRWAMACADPPAAAENAAAAAGASTALERGYRLTADSVRHLVQAFERAPWTTPPRLWLVTRGSQAVVPGDAPSPVQATLWGLGRSIDHEHPDLACTRIDLGPPTVGEDAALLTALPAPVAERDLALRGDALHVCRLVPGATAETTPPQRPAGDQPFRLETDGTGTLEHLHLRAFPPPEPRAGELLIEVRAAGLNFRDLLKALGTYPGMTEGEPALGDECAGVVVAVGADVPSLRAGDEVVAVAARSLGTHVLADARLVAPKPPGLDFDQAATLPIAFLTAAYALEDLGRLGAGERVLVHAAAGGVGLAAVQLAQAAGAQVLATAGSEEKRAYLRAAGVTEVMDSRSLGFAEQILAATGGRGVDLVLNSLAGEFIDRSIATLAPFGRFIEIGKRDIYRDRAIGLGAFRRNLGFFAVDLERLFAERPVQVGDLLRRILARVTAGELRPLPVRRFPIADVRDAFHLMQQSGHIGKIVVSTAGAADVPVTPPARPPTPIHRDASYLVTGGFGGLGLRVGQWLAEQGARHLVLIGRRGAPPDAEAALRALAQAGVTVTALAADVSRADDVADVLAHIRRHSPPLRGVVHTAGVLADGILLQQDADRFRRVAHPKADGGWHLHVQTGAAPLDFFVLFSSVTSVLGSPGQSNYAAANAFLDALAHRRRAEGLPALSINWGPWSRVGMAARLAQGGREALRGLRPINPDEGVAVLATLLRQETAGQVSVVPFDAADWVAAYPASGRSNQLALLAGAAAAEPDPDDQDLRQALLAAEPGRPRRSVLEQYVREQVAQVLRLTPSRVDSATPLRSFGIDSLMSLELRNRLEQGLKLPLAASLTWNYPTIEALVPYLAQRLRIPLAAGDDPPPADQPPAPGAASGEDDLAQLSAEELEALLWEELKEPDS